MKNESPWALAQGIFFLASRRRASKSGEGSHPRAIARGILAKNKNRVVHLIVTLDSGGCENMLARTLPVMPSGLEHIVVTLQGPGELAGKFRDRGVKVISLNLQSLYNLKSLLGLVREIRELRPSIVITYLFHADFVGRLFLQRRLKVPVVPFLRTTYNFSRYWPARLFEKLTKQWVRHYLANSIAVKDYYVQQIGVSTDKITVIPNGLELAVFDQADRNKVVAELNLPIRRFVISCVANLSLNKGQQYLLKAFDRIHRSYPEVWLLIVGTGEQANELQKQAKICSGSNQIVFMGRRHDVTDILVASDAFALPTLFEGMSNALLEAMAAGLPIVTTDIPENRAIITDQQTGLLCEVADATDLQKELQLLLDEPKLCRKLGDNARRFIEYNFQLPVIAKRWNETIRILQIND